MMGKLKRFVKEMTIVKALSIVVFLLLLFGIILEMDSRVIPDELRLKVIVPEKNPTATRAQP